MKALLCPSCGGQIKLTDTLLKEKYSTCEYCGTLFDLHDTAEKQDFDISEFLKNFSGTKSTTTTTTVNTNTVVIKNGKVVSGDGQNTDDILKSVKEQLEKSGIHIDNFNIKTEDKSDEEDEKKK
jgi:hypothetical protein